MPKNNSRAKSSRKPLTERKPLTDISNGGKIPKAKEEKKISKQQEEEQGADAVLDRLLLAHSDLSKLINQIVTDQASNYKLAGKWIMEESKIYWTPCAAHCVNLMLSDVSDLPLVHDLVEEAKCVTIFIYNHTKVLHLMRNHTDGRDIVRPSVTRFATSFLCLQSIFEQKQRLRNMIASPEWMGSKWAKTPTGKDVRRSIKRSTFWNHMHYALKIMAPLVDVVRLVDTEEKPSMGYIYKAIEICKEKVKKNLGEENEEDKEMWKVVEAIIDDRWKAQLNQPLHAAAYYLNPMFYYATPTSPEEMESNGPVKEGLLECITKLTGDLVEEKKIIVQLVAWRTRRGRLGKPNAVACVNDMAPVEWWVTFGSEIPELQRFAKRVLGLTTSASPCERNWSTFSNIDELVVQALNVKVTNRKGIKEIVSFTNVLSDMHSSLKSWIPRFQQSLSSPAMESENQLGQTSPIKTFPTANDETNDVDSSPEPLQLGEETRVSPSPLVSWCADRTIESGRQLFLLTPLPRPKGLSSKRPSLSRSVFERKMDGPFNTTLGRTSFVNISEIINGDMLEGEEIKATPTKTTYPSHSQKTSISELGIASPPKFSNRDHSMFLMTPCLKRSPPKSCVLLEPIAESFQQKYGNIPKSTSLPDASEPCSGHVSKSLALKYPQLFCVQKTGKYESKEVQASPPKSCVLMEPPREKLSANNPTLTSKFPCTVIDKQSESDAAAIDKDIQRAYQLPKKTLNQGFCSATANLECTPLWKESASMLRTGKQPGENTLKRELWTKFEAASSNVMRFDDSVLLEMGKGFLDRLDEVSCEQMSPVLEEMR